MTKQEDQGESQWNPLTELKDWKAVANDQLCQKIARKLGQRLAGLKQKI